MLAEWIKKCLLEYGNHAEIARRAQVDRTQVSRLASSGRGVRLETLYRVVQALDEVGYKLGGATEPQAEARRQHEIQELLNDVKRETDEHNRRIREKIDRLESLLSS